MTVHYKVALIGRPNVGKSALFNRIVKQRRSIVEDVVGVTRDRVYEEVDIFGKTAQFIDTGGVDCENSILFSREIKEQAMKAIDEADLLVLVVDARVGITLHDEEIAGICFKKKKPILLAVNKVDSRDHEGLVHEFHSLGIEEIFGVSALHGNGVADLLQRVHDEIPPEPVEKEKLENRLPKVAIIGRPNVGKSTIFNALLNDHRQVISEIAGTTRDAVDEIVDGLIFIDTAGLKRKKSEKESVEKFATIRTYNALKEADICLFVIDAYEGLTTEEKKILTTIEEEGKGCVLFLNKWDTVKKMAMEEMLKKLKMYASFLNHVPVIIGSGKSGRNIEKIIPAIREVSENFTKRITTGQLNNMLEAAVQRNHPPMITGKRLRIYYLTQVRSAPPRFVLFVNDPKLMPESYRRYLTAQLRKAYQFTGCPLRLTLRSRSRKEKKSGASRELQGV